jgi:hypothetical protein
MNEKQNLEIEVVSHQTERFEASDAEFMRWDESDHVFERDRDNVWSM